MIVNKFQICHQMQLDFAQLSGDVNPQHIDPVAARRLMFGKPVVHGIHLLLRILETIVVDQSSWVSLSAVRVSFDEPIGIGDNLRLEAETDGRQIKFVLLRGIQRAVRGRLDFSNAAPDRFLASPPDIGKCRNLAESELPNLSGTLFLGADSMLLAKVFPTLAAKFDLGQLALILATTRLVGMECPGLHSIYGGLRLQFSESTSSSLNYWVSNWSPSFRMLELSLGCGGASGTIDCFMPPSPVAQPLLSAVKQRVKPQEFAEHHILVIGGSRGLGETAAKIGAAGGASVTITYKNGASDAERVVAEINGAGGRANAFQYDILSPSLNKSLSSEFTVLLFFATPHIRPNRRKLIDANLLADLVEFYAVGLLRTFEVFLPYLASQAMLCMPSTIFIDKPDPAFREYATAKLAAEIVTNQLSKSGVRVICPRLPRLSTDQTSALIDIGALDPLKPMLELLRACAK